MISYMISYSARFKIDALRHWPLLMTGTEPCAPLGAAGRRPNRDYGLYEGHAGAAHCYAKLRRRRDGGTTGRARAGGLRVDACTTRHHSGSTGDCGPRAAQRSCVTRRSSCGCRRNAVTHHRSRLMTPNTILNQLLLDSSQYL
jgi:hypothetical protein